MPKKIDKIAQQLSAAIKGDVLVDVFNRIAFSTDAGIYQIIPQCVVAPRSTDDIVNVVNIARQNNIPLAPRGAGSGLGGESLSSGIVIDTFRYMKAILHYDEKTHAVTCEPGVVLDNLNTYLADFGRKIGPDPSSSNRAVIGGVVANNSTGAHSLQYGYIADYVEKLQTVLADGSVVEFTNSSDPAASSNDAEAKIAASCFDLLSNKDELIKASLPSTKRNRCGYNIADICKNGKVNIARLLTGSEGTLGIFTKITLRTVPLPKQKALIQFEFQSFEDMAAAVPLIVKTGAAACELMDHTLIKLATQAIPQYKDILPPDCAALLLVEHTADTIDQLKEKIQRTQTAVGTLAQNDLIVFDPIQQNRIWKSRKDAVPLLQNKKGHAKAIGFIEDVSVENTMLGHYIAGLEQIGKKYDIPIAYFGHAGDGELHIRPYLDLADPEDVEKMRSIAADVFSLAWSLGGTISGEHADGLLHAAFIKKQYGPEYYDLLVKIKNIFDPLGIMNPGKIINFDPDIMTKNLRGSIPVFDDRLTTNLKFTRNQFHIEVNQCTGCGVCLAAAADSRMCPVFRAEGSELASSRAKANLLRAWITGQLTDDEFQSPRFKEILSLCVNCRMCSLECPSGVDISKLITEARTELAKRKGFTIAETALAHNRCLSILSSTFAPISNLVMSLPPFKWFLELFAGLDKARSMPRFLRSSFIRKGRKFLAAAPKIENPIDKVAYFVDSYANYNDHQLGFAVIKTLTHNNIDVVLPPQRPVPLPAISYGDIKTAKRDLQFIVNHFADLVRNGYKVVCSEPSAALCLRDELKLFINSADAILISQNTFELMDYLKTLNDRTPLKTAPTTDTTEFIYHRPCHLRALTSDNSTPRLLHDLTGVKLTDINAGCCGIAGTFGMQKKNASLSAAIGKNLADALNKTDTKNITTECAACKMQIEHLTGKKVTHPIKILAHACGLLQN